MPATMETELTERLADGMRPLQSRRIPIDAASLTQRVFLLDLKLGKYGQSKKVNTDLITVDADKERVRASKKIMESPQVRAIGIEHGRIRSYIESMEIPTDGQFRGGMYLIPYTLLPKVETYLEAAEITLSDRVAELIAVYDEVIANDRIQLRSLFDLRNYPKPDVLKGAFSMVAQYVLLTTPEGLQEISKDLYDRERAKLERLMAEAAESSRVLIIEQAKELAEKIVERLAPSLDGKPKIFRDSLLKNWDEFLSTFVDKNITDDSALAGLMEEVKAKISGKSCDDLRKSAEARTEVRELFKGLTEQLDAMIIDKPIRKISFED